MKSRIPHAIVAGLSICLTASSVMSQHDDAGQAEHDVHQITVTATRLEMPSDRVGSSITTITADDLERTRVRDVQDALRMAPGVAVARSGGPGQTSSVFVRGAPGGFTQVLVDGVKVNDPSGIGTAFDFGNFNVDNIERIEVLRGPQSTLYGSDAMAGVINIITRKGEGEPSSFVDVEAGSYETWKVTAGSSGDIDRFDYSVTLSHFDTGGIPATDQFDERDGYRNNTLSSRVGYQFTDEVSLSLITRYSDSDISFDAFDAFGMPTDEGRIEKEELFLRAETDLTLMDGFWSQKLGVGHARHRRDFLEQPGQPDDFFEGDVTTADWQHNLYWSEMHTFTLGADWERNKIETRTIDSEDMHTLGFFAQDHISVADRWFTTLGARLDDNNRFGSETTYRAASAYHLLETGTKFKASYGTGFKAPSLFEMFADDAFAAGNPDLDPQTSRGWDAGIEQAVIGEHLSVGATYFDIKYDDLIAWVPGPDMMSPGTFRNINSARSKGVETFIASRPAEFISARLDYTYLDNSDDADGSFEFRRPSDLFAARVDIMPMDRLSVTLHGQYVGSRTDFGDERLDAYTLVHLAASYEVSRALTVYGRVENLFDEDYVEVAGFRTPGIAGYAGVRATF